jgi:hypothetical protein
MVTGTVADARPLEAILRRPVQGSPVPFDGLALTVSLAGAVPETGVTERKLLHVVSEMVTVNGEEPAVLAM